MEKDILNYSPTVMFRETRCSLNSFKNVTCKPVCFVSNQIHLTIA